MELGIRLSHIEESKESLQKRYNSLRSELKKEGNVADCKKKKTISYVVAHEMSHLKEMNHSAKFWSIVRKIDPNYQASIVWLRKYGTSLYQYLPKA